MTPMYSLGLFKQMSRLLWRLYLELFFSGRGGELQVWI